MGWTETHYDRKLSHKERREELDKLLTWESDTQITRVKHSTIKNNVYYSAVEVIRKDTQKTQVVGVVGGISERKDGIWGYWYGEKIMEETCGPYHYDCPVKILDMLTPTDSEWANEWREKCREQAKKPNLSRLPEGTVIEFECPFDTNYFNKGDTVRLEKMWRTHNCVTNRTTYAWSTGYCRWKQKMIPRDFRIVNA